MGNAFPGELAAEARARRGSLRLSQRELAELAGVSERFVRFVEQGKRTVQLDSLLALLDTLGWNSGSRPGPAPQPGPSPARWPACGPTVNCGTGRKPGHEAPHRGYL